VQTLVKKDLLMKNYSKFSSIVRGTVLASLFIFIGFAGAQQKFVRAQATEAKREDALAKAKLAAWKNYLGTLQGAKLDNIIANEKVFIADIDSFVVDINVIDEKCAAQPPSCTVTIKASINESIVESRLRQGAKAAGVAKGGSKVDDSAAFLVMARVADVKTAFDPKVTKRAESTVGTSGSSASADAAATNKSGEASVSADSASVTQSSKTVTGGSQEIKREKIVYGPWGQIADLESGIGESLTNNQISFLPWGELAVECGVADSKDFSKDFSVSEDGQLPPKTRLELFKKLRECPTGSVQRVILASIEVDGYRKDPNTGLWLASGNVNITVFELKGARYASVGSANRNISGRAEVLTDASRNALQNASKVASDVIVNQMNLLK
jgi:hypothetical protein